MKIVVPLTLALLGGCVIGSEGADEASQQDPHVLGLGSLTLKNLLPGLSSATDLGAAPATTPMSLVITLPRPNLDGERALADAEHTPGNAKFGTYLTPAQFAAQFGVPAASASAVTAWLEAAGLTVTHTSAARDQIFVKGTVAQVDGLLKTGTHSFSFNGLKFLANTAPPTVPSSLGIANIVGLNTLQKMAPPARLDQTSCIGTTCIGTTTPQDMWTAYQQPTAYEGQGQSIAIFGEGATDGVITDLRQFEAEFGLPQIPVTVVHPPGQTDFTDDSGHEEWNIDTQASSGMAPKAKELRLYFATDLSDASVIAIASQWAEDATGPLQASASFGECETVPVVTSVVTGPLGSVTSQLPIGLGNNLDSSLEPVVLEAAVLGKTLFASTGDTGSSCPLVAAPVIGAGNGLLNQGVPLTNSPASLPYVVGVGGTVLYTDGNGNRSREYGWAFSGGGSTLFTAAPSYQSGIASTLLPCVTSPTTKCRGIADVAAQSGDVATNGYAIVSAGADSLGGGTSLSSPLWVGMWTRIQSASAHAAGNGFAGYPIYRLGTGSTYARDFFDVSSFDTTNGLPATNGAYVTTPGWDYVTGFGTPRVNGLICDIDGKGC